jgi:hypothetical protein
MFKSKFFLFAVIISFNLSECIYAQADNSLEEEHHEGLHFSHPLFTESISPDTKFRFDYQYSKLDDNTKRSELHLEYEYAFNSSFSISITAPYVFLAQPDRNKLSNLGNIELSFKFANYGFEHSNLLLGYGLAVGLPTGSLQKGIGNNHITDLEPFFNLGYMINNFEFTFFSTFGIPANLHQGESVENDWNLQLAAIYNFTYSIQGILEFNRESISNGNISNNVALYVAPGIKVMPFKYMPKVIFGLGVRLPISGAREFNSQLLFSMFYHF